MKEINEILLTSNFDNKLEVNGKLGWFLCDYNASTGYIWKCFPDNSGVYEMVEEGNLYPSTPGAVGVPGKDIWKFKAINKGKGSIKFEQYPPGVEKPVDSILVNIIVN